MANAPTGADDVRGRAPEHVLEDLAVAVMSADASDESAVKRLLELLDELAAAGPSYAESAAEAAARIRAAASDVRALGSALDAASEAVAEMQESASRGPRQPQADPGAFVMPEWGDEKTLRDFLAGQKANLDELEAVILEMESGAPEPRASFKRRLHTMKGEAGVLGLEDMEAVCHATEDFLEAGGSGPEVTDRLLKVRDWMAKAAEFYALMRKPEPAAEVFVGEALSAPTRVDAGPQASDLGPRACTEAATPVVESFALIAPVPAPAAAPPQAAAPAAPSAQNEPPASPTSTSGALAPEPPPAVAPTATPAKTATGQQAGPPEAQGPRPEASPAAGAGEKVLRDAETVGLFGEFLTESAEGLNRVDQSLIQVERDGANADTVNGLFRVFHTIKGTAGFLELTEVVELAHDTETMLNHCRENALRLEGGVIDLVFDATSAMREMLEAVRVAIEGGTAVPARPGLEELLARIDVVNDGVTGGEEAKEQQEPQVEQAPDPAPAQDALEPAPERARAPAAEAAPEQPPASAEAASEQPAAPAPEPLAAAQARPAQPEADGPVRLKETIKVDLERVDSLVEMIGELVVVESMVVNAPEISKAGSVRVRNCLAQLAKVTRDLQDVGMRMRMVPVAGVFQKMARLVRDLSRKSGKRVRFATFGESTEMDRSMVEQIADPLVHMIRNAVDHGLEAPEARARAGKPAEGQIRLGAYHEGGSVIIEIADDGRGLDRDAIARKAMGKGLIASPDVMTDAEIHSLIFAPGFSTADKVTEISGRGVGMDVVKRGIEAMRGRIIIESTPGAGTRFKLVLPLTLAIIDGMLVACGEERYIIPTLSIVESIQPDRKMLLSLAQRNEMINLRGEILPLLRLDRLFGLSGAKADPTQALVVVVEGFGRRIGLLVDEVVTQQQVVIKSLGEGLGSNRFMSGAAILSDGRVGLILNVEEIATLVQKSRDFFHDRGAALEAAITAVQEANA
jgi:two-component system chemotaxis sensor kinase CheA